ncbi:dihydroxyacetone kinase subunit DhaK [Paenibacillus baekrokdamisoli]|uniref:Dihydroxyacetone kinase subunit DhaK n=1 Tax=Paenibacillus baekrokdamisoli TaxID=1712516 RepID=A0A3G9JN80_9BACL|nr:dihydroxyacetone kinase subunit DhaK [Paenibacillus baekrokdamisoli]MBB3071470.1 dihydroxyacetone kinase-like protein [Paenibacillus baekrokdamisoli]BBH24499.1 dihydroxyacetone kinase subunit DhaK [Paenibacillus baekrokdamisoli]
MKKLINHPDAVVDEMIEGYAAAYPQYVSVLSANKRSVVSVRKHGHGKVGVVIGGGSGHEPAFMGFIGKGMADGVPVGNIFASPPPNPILEVTKTIDSGAGVIYIYGNYAGDCMNFDMAVELADMEGIRVETVLVTDDIASAPAHEIDKRRGIAGGFLVFKTAGAAAERGYTLNEVERVTRKANDRLRTMGVGLSPCRIPQTGKPSFTLGDGEMEIGLGIHGEPGIQRGSIVSADETADILLDAIRQELRLESGSRVAVLVNGLGSTTRMELLILFRRVDARLRELGISISRSYVGEYVTSLEMGGCSLSILKLDEELELLIDDPADTPMFVQMG